MQDFMEHEEPTVGFFRVSAREESSELTKLLDGRILRMAYGWTEGETKEQAWVPVDDKLGLYIEDYILSGDLIPV